MTPNIRYTAQRFGSNEWLSLDLPLTTDGPWETYNTYEVMEATISPEVGAAIAEDGRPVMEKWGTWIHAESPDLRLWTGIVEDVFVEGATMHLSVRDWHGYPDGMTHTKQIWGVQADPADLAREVWDHLQSFDNSDLGVTVVGETPVRLGSESEDIANGLKDLMRAAKKPYDDKSLQVKAKEAQIEKVAAPYDKSLKVLDRERKVLTRAYDAAVRNRRPQHEIDAAKALVDAKTDQVTEVRNNRTAVTADLDDELEILREQLEPLQEAYNEANEKYREAEEKVREDGGAWKALVDDLPDSWKILQDLSAEAPFDFIAKTERTDGAPKLTFEILYPSIGSTRNDLVFEQGWNISEIPSVDVPEEYASEIIGVGAGEGTGEDEKVLRVTISEDDPRMRRNKVFSDPAITKLEALRARSRKELALMRSAVVVPEIKVFDTPNTPIGSWRAGDIVHIKLHTVPHFGRVSVKHRIKSWQRVGSSQATLRLEPVNDN